MNDSFHDNHDKERRINTYMTKELYQKAQGIINNIERIERFKHSTLNNPLIKEQLLWADNEQGDLKKIIIEWCDNEISKLQKEFESL